MQREMAVLEHLMTQVLLISSAIMVFLAAAVRPRSVKDWYMAHTIGRRPSEVSSIYREHLRWNDFEFSNTA